MRNAIVVTLTAVLCWAGECDAATPIAATQGVGARAVGQTASATRIITLAPSLTELVFAAGAGDKLVGVSAYSDYPASAVKLPQIANAAGISWESLLALKPDLVLAWNGGTPAADMARLKALGIDVIAVDIQLLDDVPRALRTVGRLAGRPASADSAAGDFQRQLESLRTKHKGKSIVRVFMEISTKPLMTINDGHVLSEIIRLCGGVNVFADAPRLVSEPSREELLARAPDTVLHGYSPGNTQHTDTSIYAGLDALRAGRRYAITADYAFRPGPRLLWATKEICDALDRSRESLGTRRP